MNLVHIRPHLFANDTMNIVCKLFNTAHILGIHSGGQVERPTSRTMGHSCGELLLRKCGFCRVRNPGCADDKSFTCVAHKFERVTSYQRQNCDSRTV